MSPASHRADPVVDAASLLRVPAARRIGRLVEYVTGVRLTRAVAQSADAWLYAAQSSPDFDAEAFSGFARANLLREWFTPLVDDEGVRQQMPGLVAELEEVRARQAARLPPLLTLCEQVHTGFEEAGVPCLFLKGLYIADRFYGDIHLRRQHDVDVLVRVEDCEAALAALARQGFDTQTQHALLRLEEMQTLAPKRAPGTINIERPDGQNLDLHIRTKSRWFHGVDEKAFWPERRTFEISGHAFETLSDEHTLVFALVSLGADLRRGAARVRHFLDLYLMLRHFDPEWDWPRFFARRRREGLLKTSTNVLALLLTLWRCGDDLPGLTQSLARHGARIEIRDEAEALALVTRPRRSLENLEWYKRLGSRSRLTHLRWSLFQDLPHTLARGLGPFRRPGAKLPWEVAPPRHRSS